MESTNKYFFKDMGVMFGRSMRHIFRSMDTIITVCITPIAMMLLFVYVFGGAIETGTENYVNYLLPGILLMAIGSGIAYVAYRLFTDKQRGIFERFHSMPIARSTVLWGHVLTSLISNGISVIVIILVALLMGFRSSASILEWLIVFGILGIFTLALTCCENTGWCRCILLSNHIFTFYQFCLCAYRYNAVSSACLCRESAGNANCRSNP